MSDTTAFRGSLPAAAVQSPSLTETLHAGKWLTVALVTTAANLADNLFLHSADPFSSVLLAPGCILPVFLWWGLRYWSAVACGALIAFAFHPGLRYSVAQASWISIPVLAAGFAAELAITARLLRRWRFQDDLSRGQDALLLVYAACCGTAVLGLVVTPIIYWPGEKRWLALVGTCAVWWLMHFASIVLLAPAWLTWKRWQTTTTREWSYFALLLAGLIVVEVIGFRASINTQPARSLLLFAGVPLAIWGVLRGGVRASAVTAVTTLLIAGVLTASGEGPFVHPDTLRTNFLLNFFLLSFGLTFNLVGCFAEENRLSRERLEIDHALLSKAEEIAGIGSWQFDVATKQEVWSPQIYRLLGLMPDEIAPDIQTFASRFVVPEDRRLLLDSWESLLQRGYPRQLELRVRRGDGQQRMLTGQADIQRDYHGRPIRIVGTLRDITERKVLAEERQRMEELLNKAEELANLGSWEIDAAGYMPRLSPNMHRLLGMTEEFHGSFENFLERFVHPDDRAHLTEAFARFAAGAGKDLIEFRLIRADRHVRDVIAQAQVVAKENGQFIRCYGTTTDITDRKEAAQNLADSEQRYRLLAENATDLITRIRSDGVANYVSPASRQILGYEPQEMLGRSVFELIAPDDQEPLRQLVASLLAGQDRSSVPYRAVRKDGSIVWLESKAKLLVDREGRRELVCITRDITERRILQEQVSQAQRLEAIGRLAGGIAHDFNNILTVINGYAEILELRFPAGDPGARYIANILEAGQRAAKLTRQLLTYSRKQLVTHGSLQINSVLERLVSLLRPLLGERIELQLQMEPALRPILADISQFEQLVMNLSINSRDAMPKGGVLTWQTANVDFSDDDPRPLTLSAGRYVRFSLVDTGVGMDESVRSRLFEPFFTTKEVGQGTGLGLATVYATVEQVGGAIAVESTLGVGTRFDLYFPTLDRVELELEHRPAPPESLPASVAEDQPSILVVEDDPHVRALVKLTLEQYDLAVTVATSGEEAVKLAEELDPFDLLLTDIVMCGMNGRELADELHLRQADLTVIFMSGHTEDAVVRQGVLHDEVLFLQKPFTADELLTRVREALAKPPHDA